MLCFRIYVNETGTSTLNFPCYPWGSQKCTLPPQLEPGAPLQTGDGDDVWQGTPGSAASLGEADDIEVLSLPQGRSHYRWANTSHGGDRSDGELTAIVAIFPDFFADH